MPTCLPAATASPPSACATSTSSARGRTPNGAYAAVIPKWTAALLKGETVYINGDGETSRDFCYIANAVQANLLAATSESAEARNQVYNVAVGDRTTLNALFGLLRDNLAAHGVSPAVQPVYRDFRAGDVRHSLADIGKAAAPAGLRAHAPAGRRGGGGDAVVCGAGKMNQIGTLPVSAGHCLPQRWKCKP